jgi:hypothetical protein
MECDGPLPCSQQPALIHWPDPDESSPVQILATYLFNVHFNIILQNHHRHHLQGLGLFAHSDLLVRRIDVYILSVVPLGW